MGMIGRRDAGGELDLLREWIRTARPVPRQRVHRRIVVDGGLRFAFYGRISTADFQDRASSAGWQRAFADDVIAGHGTIVAEFFDVGVSRRLDWPDRPQAAALLAEMATPMRRFDAIVVGEFERAFYGDQYARLAPLFDRHRIEVWLPEVDGPINRGDPTHLALLLLLGAQSKREVLRSRYRVTAAMSAQASQQGRHLGGRPPYGYRLVDAGPHPNRVHAEWGRRLHRLDPDPATEGHVRWMFAQRLAGQSTASIARTLNSQGVPCPSRADPIRNPHRSGDGWTLRTVAAILSNPRYTGRQVWNRQRTDRDLLGAGQDVLASTTVHRWNAAEQWVISATLAHPGLVSEEDFVAAQAISAVTGPDTDEPHIYLLVGLLRCGICDRALDSHWTYRSPAYRCRHGHTSAQSATTSRPKNVYVRQDVAIAFAAAELDIADESCETVADHLRASAIVIICGPGGPTLERLSNPMSPRAPIIPRQRRDATTPAAASTERESL
jgi:site-specific DNA recombinase